MKNFSNRKGISPVVGSALLLVVAVVSVIGFQTWFTEYSSSTFVEVEQSSNNAAGGGNVRIEGLIDGTLFLLNTQNDNQSISSLKVGDQDCSSLVSELEPGMNQLDVTSCVQTLTSGSAQEIVLVTPAGVSSVSKTINTGY